MKVPVEIVLKGRDFAVTDSVDVAREPSAWTDVEVREVLVGMLRAIAKVESPAAAGRAVVLTGFSWIVEPHGKEVVIAIEIPMGAAVAGPIDIGQAELDAMITRLLRAERAGQWAGSTTVH